MYRALCTGPCRGTLLWRRIPSSSDLRLVAYSVHGPVGGYTYLSVLMIPERQGDGDRWAGRGVGPEVFKEPSVVTRTVIGTGARAQGLLPSALAVQEGLTTVVPVMSRGAAYMGPK